MKLLNEIKKGKEKENIMHAPKTFLQTANLLKTFKKLILKILVVYFVRTTKN